MLYPVIYGSVRPERQGIRAARFVCDQVAKRGHEAHLIDPQQVQLPLLGFMYKEYKAGEAPEQLEKLADLFRRADGFLVVTAEYNHSMPPALVNLLDHFLEEYYFRPSGIVCYSAGRFGGVRAAMHARMMLGELGMPTISSILAIPNVSAAFSEDGTPQQDFLVPAAARFLDEFDWWAEAGRNQRSVRPPPF